MCIVLLSRLSYLQELLVTGVLASLWIRYLLGISKQQALADAVTQFVSANHQGVIIRRVFAEALVRDKELLERLADA